jgi:hypothetical protein
MTIENTALFLNSVGEYDLAIKVVEVFSKYAEQFEQFDDISKTFFKLKDYDKSIKFGESAYAIASSPQQMYVIRHNLINVYNHNNEPEKALRYIKANEAVITQDTDRDFEKAFSLFLMNKKQQAASILRDKLNDQSLTTEQQIKVEFNLGTYDLIDGNLQQGLKRFLLAGEQLGIWDNTKTFITQPLDNYGLSKWNGVVKPNANLLIIAEAGIGDEIINVRFVKRIESYGINVIWLGLSSRTELVEIYKLNGINAVSNIKQVPTEFLKTAEYIPSMQLPIALNCDYTNLWSEHYLTKTFEQYDEKWKNIINSPKFKVGLRFRGAIAYDQDLHRSIPFAELYSAVNKSSLDTTVYSIQKDEGVEELTDEVIALHDKLDTLYDLFSAIKNLDLVITSCTSCAHIAAAMGKEVCIIVPISCYYVWCNPTKTTPWYGNNVHIFYQESPRSWKEPLEQLTNYLNTL